MVLYSPNTLYKDNRRWYLEKTLATFCGLFPSYFPRVYNCCSLTSASVYGQVAHDCCCLWTHCPCSSTIGREAVGYPPLGTVKTQQDKALAVLSGVGWGPTSNRTPDYTTFRGLFQSTSLSNQVLHNIQTISKCMNNILSFQHRGYILSN